MITEILLNKADTTYKSFYSALIPNLNEDIIIGVRIPELRKIAKEIYGSSQADKFISELPHKYYDENNLHAFLIELTKEFDDLIIQTERFLPFIDNWSTCDSFNPKIFKNDPQALIPYIFKWLTSDHAFTVRYAIKLLMTFFLDDLFCPEYMLTVADIKSEEYYVNMMIAWYFATALAKQYQHAICYLEHEKLPVWIHNKVIQKAIESYKIDVSVKNYLKTLKIHS